MFRQLTWKCALIMLTVGHFAQAQKVDYNAIILPKTATEIDFSEKLVQLAWQNSPNTEILNRQLNISNYDVKLAKRDWLNHVLISGNLNEFSIKSFTGSDNTNPVASYYPRYNIGVAFSLGNLFNDNLKTRIQREEMQIAIQNLNKEKLALRAEVLSKYQVYVSNRELLRIKNQIMTDSYSDFKLKEQSFSRGEISLQDYNISLDRYNQQLIAKVQAEKDLELARIDIEKSIGMKLSDVQ
jgi:outer membrane protein TolC